MNIIHILKGKANPSTMNGVNKVVHHLATEQLRLGANVEVWGITATPGLLRQQQNYPLRLFPSSRIRFFPSKILLGALRTLSPKDTIVHLHSVYLPELYGISRILKTRKIPWVLSPHGGYASQSTKKNWLAKSIYMRFFEKRLITGSMKVHALGTSEVENIHQIDPSVHVVLIPNGQSLEEVQFEPAPCSEPKERPIIGFCGRLAMDHKGLDLLLSGFARYKNCGGKGELFIIGDGPDKALLTEIINMEGIHESVTFLGALFGNAKLNQLYGMDLFVHTSRWEGMPMALLEAAALEKPLLVSKATNLDKHVQNYGNGIVLALNDPETIAEALFDFWRLYATGKDKEMGAKSRKLIENELNWPNIAGWMIKTLYSQTGN